MSTQTDQRFPVTDEDQRSEIAKLVWSYLKYTTCKTEQTRDGVRGYYNNTVIEINDVWGLIRKLEPKKSDSP